MSGWGQTFRGAVYNVYLWAVLGTPDVCSAEPEHLAGSVVEPGEGQLGTVPG
jgi:hypothetical protein